MKLVICWPSVSGYMAACCRALAARSEVDLTVVAMVRAGPSGQHQDFDDDLLSGIPCRLLDERDREDPRVVAGIVRDARPDVVFVSGWKHAAYRRLVSNPELSSVKFMMGMDTPWWGTLRQRLARFKIGRYLARMERVLVPGERAWQSARNMGAREERIRRCSLYGIEPTFLSLLERRTAADEGWPRRFLFVGRYVEVKAIDVLLEAYGEYRRRHEHPWSLSCCGAGPLEHLVESAEGVRNHGFVQPADLPAILLEHGALINVARYEPWGQVIVEAAASGLPVISSEACGATVEIVHPYYSGLTVPTGDVEGLVRAMEWMHEHADRLPQMGMRGHGHAAGFSAEIWAERWVNILDEICPARAAR